MRSPRCDIRSLVYRQSADEVGTDGAEVDRTPAGRRRESAAVHQGLVKGAAESANGDTVGLAPHSVTLDRHARQTLKRCRHVRIGKVADLFGGDHVHHARRIALRIEVALQRSADAGDDDRVVGAFLGGLVAGSRILRERGRRNRDCQSARDANPHGTAEQAFAPRRPTDCVSSHRFYSPIRHPIRRGRDHCFGGEVGFTPSPSIPYPLLRHNGK